MIYKPRLVRAEWGSIEAMSGADDEETAGGGESTGSSVAWDGQLWSDALKRLSTADVFVPR